MSSSQSKNKNTQKKSAQVVLRRLKKMYPRVQIALKYKTNIQLLVAVILSAQCTDKKVNEVTKELFKKYKTVDDFANANLKTFEQEIRQTGFYRAKAKNIINTAKIIKKEFNGKIPKTMEEMIRLSGVARKTANVVLGELYGKFVGIAVDTHVRRVAGRLGLTKNTDPVKIERDLMELFDERDWPKLTLRFIEHGRKICDSRRPRCEKCGLSSVCPSAFSFE